MLNMPPPPTTPAAQPRFLPLKRQAAQSQKKISASLQHGPQQFVATPRFSLASTQRPASIAHQPPPFSTPAPASAKLRASRHEPTSDAIDTSPISSDIVHHEDHRLNESIEIDSPVASQSSSGDDAGRLPKRRRISISPEVDVSPLQGPDARGEFALEYDVPEELSPSPAFHETNPLRSASKFQEDVTDLADSGLSSSPLQQPAGHANPTFQKPPRFKAVEMADNVQICLLPDAFSPQRRGAKYVPGGLAAELQDWLVQVKGGSEYDRPTGSNVQFAVDQVKSGAGMWLVAAHQTLKTAGDVDIPARAILAGDGQISGLGRKSIVSKGSTISIAQPVWDINLEDLGQFAVACDWATESFRAH